MFALYIKDTEHNCMPLAYDEEHVQLRQLLRSLQVQSPEHIGGWFQDWYRDSFGEKWYWEIEQKCTNLLSITIPESFKMKADDFRPNLTAFRDRCHQAYLAPKTKRTPALEKEMLSLWQPLLPQLETSRTTMLRLEKDATKNRGQLILQYQQVDGLIHEMANYVVFCKHT
jgi:hypothetical protein